MTTPSAGDKFIPVQTADGKTTAFKASTSISLGDKFIPVISADGKTTAMKVSQVTSKGDNGFPVMTADGKVILVKGKSTTCFIDRLLYNYDTGSLLTSAGNSRNDIGIIKSGDYVKYILNTPVDLPENTYVVEVPTIQYTYSSNTDIGFNSSTTIISYFSFEFIGLGVIYNGPTMTMSIGPNSKFNAYYARSGTSSSHGILLNTSGGTLTGIKIKINVSMSNPLKDYDGTGYNGNQSTIKVENITTNSSFNCNIGSMYIDKSTPPCYKTTEADVSFDETDEGNRIAGWSFYVLYKSAMMLLKNKLVITGSGYSNSETIYFQGSSNYFHPVGVGKFSMSSTINWVLTYDEIPATSNYYNSGDGNYYNSYMKVYLKDSSYMTTFYFSYNSTYMYRRKP